MLFSASEFLMNCDQAAMLGRDQKYSPSWRGNVAVIDDLVELHVFAYDSRPFEMSSCQL